MYKMQNNFKMYFGKGKKKSTGGSSAPPPEIAGALPSAFGRYIRYGRRTAFGRRVFGFGNRYPQFGGLKLPGSMGGMTSFGSSCGSGKYGEMTTAFGRRRRRGVRKGGRKSRKPSKALMRSCRKHGIKCTKKVGGKRVYKSLSVLKRQLRKKKSLRRRKNRKVRRARKVRHARRRRAMFGKRRRSSRRVSLFGFKI